MILVIKMLMAIAAGILIAKPLFKSSRQSIEPALDGLSDNPKETVFTALGEIEFEYNMHKLEREDYEELKSKYQLQALDLLDEEDQTFDREIEQQIKKHRKRKKD
ncbi:hypothetical protein Desdi_1117 [Desulfitobacterium dichloroeliminans LMG P-21439]|uniref:Uncharacterized protein n=1 Tax=Desulfitobacterium dichloroeliminans (strain LMG P-21439 / DCA1) TaxID=871963 RepID=L0F629_DESDL|nr:hypothetical protein [Desulfitobacterium dichloroeliminans]AGA68632.1 hypothetical protein Desdi_1117 [Desulfitobacterium dichloroeliminans LMG P-21439]